jgi:hypothetical protein
MPDVHWFPAKMLKRGSTAGNMNITNNAPVHHKITRHQRNLSGLCKKVRISDLALN